MGWLRFRSGTVAGGPRGRPGSGAEDPEMAGWAQRARPERSGGPYVGLNSCLIGAVSHRGTIPRLTRAGEQYIITRRSSEGGNCMTPTTTEAPGRAKNVPAPPTFGTIAEERRHRQERLAAAFRLFARFGYDEGVAGHITARDPGNPEWFWVNPFGVHFGQIRVSDLILVDDKGEVIQGNYPVNTAAFAIHSRVHAARPDAVAAAHAHSMYGKAWSSLGRLLDPITQDACAL